MREFFRSRFFVQMAGVMTFVAAISACATPSFDKSDPGHISGRLMVFWVGEDKFIYYPYYEDALTYTLPKAMADKLGPRSIRPGAIYTDGGSIPRPVRGVVGFSPWGYGPAYIVHDWLFVAHRCILTDQVHLLDKRDHDEVKTVGKVDFAMSADMLASVIAALIKQDMVPPRSLAPSAIYTAVDSFVARRLWNSRDPKGCRAVEKEHIEKIEASLRQKRVRGLEAMPVDSGPPFLIYQQDF